MLRTSLFCACFLAGSLYAAEMPVNLSLQPGVKLSADSHLRSFTADKAADGDNSSKESRWVSLGEEKEHWLLVDFGKEQEVNHVTLQFWNDSYVSVDFDIQVKTGNTFKTVREIRGNGSAFSRITFPTVKTSALRVHFLRQVSDNMVRLFEIGTYRFPHAIEATLGGTFSEKGILTGTKPVIKLVNCENGKQAEIDFSCTLLDVKTKKEIAKVERKVKFDSKTEVALPVPPNYGSFLYVCNLFDAPVEFLYFPATQSKYRTTSPFGAHYHSSDPVFVEHAGLYWWRNHDVYGRWNHYQFEKGKHDWSELDVRLDYVRDNKIRECSVLLGAPSFYSTILPGEPAESPQSWLYSYYPPSDLDAWETEYLTPYVKQVMKASPFRAHETWNEAWSYYRLRGLHGTPGEAMELFRRSYDVMKKLDPEALVYATDVKPEMTESAYAFKGFGRDMLELGFLRYNDLLSYHSYSLLSEGQIERLRRNAWTFGRDLDLWSTETATEGKPHYTTMESLVVHRASGNGKTFIYTGSRWAPLMLEGKPTLYLVAQAALCRTLGDALPLGSIAEKDYSCYLFANGGNAVAVIFAKGKKSVKLPVAVAANAEAQDMFGNKLAAAGEILSVENPVIVLNPGSALVRKALASRIGSYTEKSPNAAEFKAIAEKVAKSSDGAFPALLKKEIKTLNDRRMAGDSEYLYYSNMVLDLLVNNRILAARAANEKVKPPVSLSGMEKEVAALWKAVKKRTGDNGVLLDTERLASRAQKEMQFAAMYDNDGDAVARDIYLECASAALANAKKRLDSDKMAELYKTKTYFRSHKRLTRSELYCFPNGRSQEAVITVANPFGHELTGTLTVAMPQGWSIDKAEIPYKVAPLSRQLLNVNITAPREFTKDKVETLTVTDKNNNFPSSKVELEVLTKIPPYPIIIGPLSGGALTGN